VQGNAYASQFPTRLACVRYGNVVGSRGSVVPLFKDQVAKGELTITDDRMTRFWITLDQAVDLVMFALDNMTGGEVFIPKIPSIRITDLAEAIAPGMSCRQVGIRPGEKLHEVLLTSDEARHSIDAGAVFVVMPEQPFWTSGSQQLQGRPLAEGFSYSSDGNDHWLTVGELQEMLA
jgi:UDP-N-acetylglucosamine 4,6-dehydratase